MSDVASDHWVERVLGFPVTPGSLPPPGQTDELDLGLDDYWRAARATFDAAVQAVDAQIGALQVALLDEDDVELNEIGETGLNALTRNTRVPLMAALLEAGDGGPALAKAAPALFAAAQDFLKIIETDPRIAACDSNPFGVDVAIADTYVPAVQGLIDVARAAMRR